MINFLLDLVSNLVLLAALLAACRLVRLISPGTNANGYLVFAILVAIALVFDAILTFLVFSDEQLSYARFCTTGAFAQRFAAYLIACAIALCLALVRMRRMACMTERSYGDDASVSNCESPVLQTVGSVAH